MRSGHTSRELWALDLDLLSWDRVDVNSGQCLSNGDRKLCGPLHSMGHTANVLGRLFSAVVIFHNIDVRYHSRAQLCIGRLMRLVTWLG